MFSRVPISASTDIVVTSSSPSSSSSSTSSSSSSTTSSSTSSSSSVSASAVASAALAAATTIVSTEAATTIAGDGDVGNDDISDIAAGDDSFGNYFADDADWWLNAIEEDSFHSPLPFDASEGGLWNGRFVPPPPRPPFLDESVASDGLTTCDLCTWAWHDRNAYSLDGSIGEAAGELGWAFTLIVVSVISAILGAIIMVTVLRCRRLKPPNTNGGRQLPWWSRNGNRNQSSGRGNITIKQSADSIRSQHSNAGVWTWLGNRRPSASPDQIGPPTSSPAENHYTHMDDAYSPVGPGDEALYAELDRESIRSANPSYQNTAYSQCDEIDREIPIVSSAPSSAYYSDLSTTGTGNDRAYEVVGLTHLTSTVPNWDATDSASNGRRPPRLAAINETTTVPSDYV